MAEIDVHELRAAKGEVFLVRVGAGPPPGEQVREGDQVIVERRGEAAEGEMVVAVVEGAGARLGRLRRDADGGARLDPPGGGVFEIAGVVIGVLRKYGLVLRSDSSSPCVAGFAEQGALLSAPHCVASAEQCRRVAQGRRPGASPGAERGRPG